jgi:hypothetical protein
MVSNPEQPLFDETLIYKNPSLHFLLCDPIILKAPTPYSIFGLVQVLVGQAGITSFVLTLIAFVQFHPTIP